MTRDTRRKRDIQLPARHGQCSVRTACTLTSPLASFIYWVMDFSPSLPSIPRLRLTRHSQLSPQDDDFSRTPTAGPSRLHALHDQSEDTDATPRLTVSSSLPSMYAVTEDTPAARLRALLAQVPTTSLAPRTQLLHEPTPSLPSDRESDFEAPPRWSNLSTSSAREGLRSIFTHALRDPGDTPRKRARRNSIDLSEVEDSPRNDRVIQERARNKGERMSFSDEELDKSFRSFGIRSPAHSI
jgi:serine/arginine repetitive matrix protein 2